MGEAFVEDTLRLCARFSGGAVADVIVTSERGTCVRRIDEESVVFRCSAEVGNEVVEELAAGLDGGGGAEHAGPTGSAASIGDAEAIEELEAFLGILADVDRAARAADDRIREVSVDGERQWQRVCVAPLFGQPVREVRELLYLTIRTVAAEGSRLATGFYTPATSTPASGFAAAAAGEEAARRALHALHARPAPARELPVVVGPGRGMVLIHEACCHPVETDEVLRGSIYADRLGAPIAAPLVTVLDDPLVAGGVGSYRFDDDGTPASPTTIVDAGRLRSFLSDRVTSLQLGVSATGNGRRQSYRHASLPRMSNTCLAAGDATPEEIISDTPIGIYAQHLGGGEVVESTGDFVFRVTNGFYIENGRLTDPIEETTIRGNGARVLLDIDAVGNDVELGAAKCGKFGQLVPVGVMGPSIRISSLVIGGTER
jgi:TldD protein